jgi:hypothetical protein
MTNWLFYTLPENRRLHYLICLWIALVIIPHYVLDMIFTVTMQSINFISYDIVYYYLLRKGFFND